MSIILHRIFLVPNVCISADYFLQITNTLIKRRIILFLEKILVAGIRFSSNLIISHVSFTIYVLLRFGGKGEAASIYLFDALPSIETCPIICILVIFSSNVFAGNSCYEASKEITNVITDSSRSVFDGLWHFYLLCMSKADKHPS